MKKIFIVSACIWIMAGSLTARADVLIDLQGGPVFTAYNDVRIPGDGGTKFSLSDELKADTAWTTRTEAGYISGRHYTGLLFTPLRVNSSGTPDRNIYFYGKTFTAGEKLSARFRFDSYRFMYRYTFYTGDIFTIGAGFTAKIRDASITLEGGGQRAERKNTGFVPIMNFAVEAKLPAGFFIFLGGDALAAPQGRAEDAALLAGYRISDTVRVKAGYRVLEGGADNDKVYTFSMFNYIVLGADARF